jgi:hypothetical protein
MEQVLIDGLSSGISGSERHRSDEHRNDGEGEQEEMLSTHDDEPRRARMPSYLIAYHERCGAGLMEVHKQRLGLFASDLQLATLCGRPRHG